MRIFLLIENLIIIFNEINVRKYMFLYYHFPRNFFPFRFTITYRTIFTIKVNTLMLIFKQLNLYRNKFVSCAKLEMQNFS